jgi:hypothetical protein
MESLMTDAPTPTTEIDYLVDGVRRQLVSLGTLYQVLLRSEVWVLCNKTWDGKTKDPELQTLIIKDADGKADFLPVFSVEAHAATAQAKFPAYPTLNKMPAQAVVQHAGVTTGLAINPGTGFSMHILPQGVDQLRKVFGPRTAPGA